MQIEEPLTDAVGADARCEHSPAFQQASELIDSMASAAERMERDGVSRDDVAVLLDAGVLTFDDPPRWSTPQARELQERLAAASGSLWFVAAQHRSPAEAARATDNVELRERYADGLAAGSLLGAVSFAHLRRPRPTVVAERQPQGWEISGRLDWITSWGIADVLLLMAETADHRVLQMLLPARERDGLTITGELSLAAMGGTSTVGAVLDHMHVGDDEVAALLPKSAWLAADELRTANVTPAVVGLARASVDGMVRVARERQWAELLELGDSWRSRLVADRARAYELLDDVEPSELVPERLALRASITTLAQDATSMLVVAQAGRAMLTSSPAQRWAREALFALVQAQTFSTRNAIIADYLKAPGVPGVR